MATAIQDVRVMAESRGRHTSLLRSGIMLRFAFVPVAVGICYLFAWDWLKYWTAEANLRIDLLAGIHLERVSFDLVRWRGALYEYKVACTFADVWCGAIPLLWHWRRSALWNLAFLLAVAAGFFAFNVFRLSVSDVLFAFGLPWNVAHNAISGGAYFAVWAWLWRSKYSPLAQWRS